MTAAAGVALAVAAVAAVADWWAVARDERRAEYVAKPLATAALAAVAVLVDPEHDAQRTWFVAALLLSLAGDVFLMLPADRFVAGLGAFLLAHLAYVAGFVAAGTDPGPEALLVLAALGAIGTPILRAVDERPLRPPVLVYMGVIGAMAVAALGTGDGVAIAGALLFLVSDALLAWGRFVRSLPHGRVAVMVSYHLAQAALAASLI